MWTVSSYFDQEPKPHPIFQRNNFLRHLLPLIGTKFFQCSEQEHAIVGFDYNRKTGVIKPLVCAGEGFFWGGVPKRLPWLAIVFPFLAVALVLEVAESSELPASAEAVPAEVAQADAFAFAVEVVLALAPVSPRDAVAQASVLA